jgi:indole-3-glycerol phosphate synthase
MIKVDGVLGEIVDKSRVRISGLKAEVSSDDMQARAVASHRPFDFVAKLKEKPVSIIAEIKFASPSEGVLRVERDYLKVAEAYLNAGAAALSVLTEPQFFQGDPGYLKEIRRRFPQCAILMKDFVVDEYQISMARAIGADAILILASLYEVKEIERLIYKADSLGLTSLVEVHDEDELERALEAKARLIGINNRDLKTMKVSLQTSERLQKKVKGSVTLVSESGISSLQEVQALQKTGFQSFLIGTSFMKTPDPGQALSRFLQGEKL